MNIRCTIVQLSKTARKMAADENKVVPEIQFPNIPESADEDMKKYLIEFETVIRGALKGSLWLERLFEDGILGN